MSKIMRHTFIERFIRYWLISSKIYQCIKCKMEIINFTELKHSLNVRVHTFGLLRERRERREWDGGCSCTQNPAQNIMAVTQSRKTIGGSGPAAWNISPLTSLHSSISFTQSHLRRTWDFIHRSSGRTSSHTIRMRNPITPQRITRSSTKDSSS